MKKFRYRTTTDIHGRKERPGSPLNGSGQRECAGGWRQQSQRRDTESGQHSFSGADGCK
jgi:hypothetical protein